MSNFVLQMTFTLIPETEIIRQMAGYSRDCAILKILGVDFKTIVPCIYIYPSVNIKESAEDIFKKPLQDFITEEYQIKDNL